MTSGSRPSMWQQFGDLVTCRLTEVPRPPAQTDSGLTRSDRERRLAALVSAYHSDAGSVVVCWHRPTASGPVQVHVVGAGLTPPADDSGQPAVLSLPPGGVAHYTKPGALAEALGEVPHWADIGVLSDPLVGEESQQRPVEREPLRPTLEDCLLGVWHEPFSWLMMAEPVSFDDLDEAIAEVGNEQRRVAAKAGSSPDYAVSVQRLEHRHRELSQAVTSGLWRLRFVAGGASPEAARRIAGLICASTDTSELPYTLTPARTTGDLATTLAEPESGGPGSGGPGGHVSSPMLAAIAATPAVEIPGLRFRLVPEFDVTPEPDDAVGPAAGLRLGVVLDRNRRPAGDLVLPRSSLNRHTFVCGATGAGKSQTVRGLLETAVGQGLPWLVVEPAKAEYRLMASRVGGDRVVAIRPGDPDQLPAGLNPLEPGVDAEGNRYPLQTHLDLVRALFLAAFEADEPFPQVLASALTRCYEQLGWDLALGEPVTPGLTPRYPTLGDLQRTAVEVVEDIGYGREITDNVRGFIAVRLSSLRLGTTGRFLEGGHPLNLDAVLRSNVVFEIEDVGDDRDKAFLMGTVLIRLVEHLRLLQKHQRRTAVGLRHLSVFEEAHRLLRNATEGPAAHAVEMFAGLLAEIRAYGEGLIIAEQIPSKILPDAIKNTAIKIVHRLPAQDDRDAVGATMNITESQSEYLVTLPPGQAAVYTDGMDYPLLAAMPDGTAREDPAVEPATPAALVAPRSITCGQDCRESPCTLRQIGQAKRILQTQRQLALWAELAVVAHLTGWAVPVPGEPLLRAIQELDQRARDCALSHAVDNAIASRSTAIADTISPGPFAEHTVEVLRTMITAGTWHLAAEPNWLAKAYRWTLVHGELDRTDREQPAAGRHKNSSDWERVYGRLIPGATCREQLEVVSRWVEEDQKDPGVLATIAFGSETESPVASAVGAQPDNPDWSYCLGGMLDEYIACSWPLDVLDAGAWAQNGSTGARRGH